MSVVVLSDDRVRVRTTTEADIPALTAIRETEAVRRRWRGEDPAGEMAADLTEGELELLTIEVHSGRIVGLIQFEEVLETDYRHASVDLFVDPALHRQGIASSAIRLVADYLFDVRGHHRLTIDPVADNHAAVACYAKVGFRPVGILRRYERQEDGTWADGLLMDMLADDRIS